MELIIFFAAICAFVLGTYWAFIVRPEQQAHHRFAARVGRGTAGARLRAPTFLKTEDPLSHVSIVGRALAHAGALVTPLQRLAAEAGVDLIIGQLVLTSACVALAAYVVAVWLTGSLLVGLLVAVCAASLPYLNLRRLRTKRLARLEEQLPDGVELIARALRAGHAFSVAFTVAADDLPAPLGTEFKTASDLHGFGMSLDGSLRALAARVPLLDMRFFVTAVLTQRETGGNLAEVLDKLGTVVRERFRVKRQVRVVSAHGRLTGWILAALPPVLAVLFMCVSPTHLQLLIGDPLGRQMIAGAAVLQIAGTLIIRRLVRLEY